MIKNSPSPSSLIWYILILGLLTLTSCQQERTTKEVTIYTSLDRPHSEPILNLFEERTGIKVNAVYDTEAAKTVGLVNRLIAEQKKPPC